MSLTTEDRTARYKAKNQRRKDAHNKKDPTHREARDRRRLCPGERVGKDGNLVMGAFGHTDKSVFNALVIGTGGEQR